MDAKPTEIIYFIFSNQTKLILLPHNNILDLKSLKLCKKLKSFMILILIIFLRSVKLSHRNIHLRGTPVYTNPAYLANLGRVGEIALCQHSRPDVAARLAGHKCSSRFTLPPCHVIGTLLGLGYYARVTAPRTNRALHTLKLTYHGDPFGQVV